MNRLSDIRPSSTSHEEWELRLQDWLDGTADASEAQAVQSHVAGCPTCTQLIEDLRQIDAQLAVNVPAEPGPGAQFDAQLFSRIADEEAARERARKTASKPLAEEELAELQRAWRTTLLRVIGIAGVVLVALAWLIASGVVPFISPATIAVTIASVTPLQWVSIGLVGGTVSLALTRWLQA